MLRQLVAGLRDPGIVTVFDAELDVAGPYLVSELVDAPTLLQRIGQGPLTEAQVIRLAAALARTLAYVRGQGIVHRGIKPSNILLPSVAEVPFRLSHCSALAFYPCTKGEDRI